MSSIKHLLYDYLIEAGLDETWAEYLNMIALVLVFLIIIYIVDLIIRKTLRTISHRLAERSKTNFDDILIANKMPRNLAHIVPLLLAYEFIPSIFTDFPYVESIIE
ncbi:MAG: mechanosensitive ion channel family protein, partial [Flavobacteriaceae bacterium]|nr:mechanosensitive ion channel family protein [Flavobacteriaceae bacterium]